jgi:AraC family transcriptional regulator, exoenzyme S synthesis regulatory protein ExsA
MFYVPDEYICSMVRENTMLLAQGLGSPISKDQVLPVQTNAIMNAFYESILAYFFSSTRPPENLLELKFKELLLTLICSENNPELTSYFCNLANARRMDDLQEIMENNCLYNLQLHELPGYAIVVCLPLNEIFNPRAKSPLAAGCLKKTGCFPTTVGAIKQAGS